LDTRRQGDTRDVCAGDGGHAGAAVEAARVAVYALFEWGGTLHQPRRPVRGCAVLRVLLMTRDRYLRGLRRRARRERWAPGLGDAVMVVVWSVGMAGLTWLLAQ